jgi:hypothetical protein
MQLFMLLNIRDMKTAVEWLVEQLNLHEYEDVIKQAKEMEKQKRIDAFDDGFQQGVQCMTCIYNEKVWDGVDDGEEYVKVQDWSKMRTRNL